MDVYFRSIQYAADEISMGQVYWFQPNPECDAISATANTDGFTPLLAIDRHFNWDRDVVTKAALACNKKGEVCIVPFNPMLFLVPATKGHGDAHFLISDLIAATQSANVKALHFTHFGFMQNRMPQSEVVAVLDYLFGNSTSLGLGRIVIDIDARIESKFYELLRPLSRRSECDRCDAV